MYNGSDLTAVVEAGGDTTHKQQSNIDVDSCGTKRRLSERNVNKIISTASQRNNVLRKDNYDYCHALSLSLSSVVCSFQQVYDSLLLTFSKCRYLQLLLFYHKLCTSYICLLTPNFLPSNRPCSILICCNTRPMHLCLRFQIVFNIFCSYTQNFIVFKSIQLIFSIFPQIHISKTSSLLLLWFVHLLRLRAHYTLLHSKQNSL